MIELDACMLLISWNSAFLEIFQKPPGGWWITARRHICLDWFCGSEEGAAWRHIPSRQAMHRKIT